MVSIICCTMRPSFLENVFSNYNRQSFTDKEMIIILNQDDMDIDRWKEEAKKYNNVSVYQLSEKCQLGKCMNYGIEKARYSIIAKFDDDDYYAPDYIKEAVHTLRTKKASIVGKHTSFLFFEEKKALMLFRDGGEKKYRRHIKGGSLLFYKSVWKKVKFNEQLVHASDADFLRRCKRKDYRIYSSSKFNYVCIRRKDISSHTQKKSTEEYMSQCKLIKYTNDYPPLITKSFASLSI